jgi:hypothetical protein
MIAHLTVREISKPYSSFDFGTKYQTYSEKYFYFCLIFKISNLDLVTVPEIYKNDKLQMPNNRVARLRLAKEPQI